MFQLICGIANLIAVGYLTVRAALMDTGVTSRPATEGDVTKAEKAITSTITSEHASTNALVSANGASLKSLEATATSQLETSENILNAFGANSGWMSDNVTNFNKKEQLKVTKAQAEADKAKFLATAAAVKAG